MLLPSSMVPKYCVGFLLKCDKILADKLPCLLSNSMRSLLEVIKAISSPEKKADVNVAIKIITELCTFVWCYCFCFACFWAFSNLTR